MKPPPADNSNTRDTAISQQSQQQQHPQHGSHTQDHLRHVHRMHPEHSPVGDTTSRASPQQNLTVSGTAEQSSTSNSTSVDLSVHSQSQGSVPSITSSAISGGPAASSAPSSGSTGQTPSPKLDQLGHHVQHLQGNHISAGQVGPIGHIGQMGQVGQPGKVSPVGQAGQATQIGQMGQMGQMGQIGQIGQIGEGAHGQQDQALAGRMGPIDPLGQIGHMDQMSKVGQMNQINQNQMNQLGQMGQMSQMGQLGQLGQVGQVGQMGQIGQMGQSQMGQGHVGRMRSLDTMNHTEPHAGGAQLSEQQKLDITRLAESNFAKHPLSVGLPGSGPHDSQGSNISHSSTGRILDSQRHVSQGYDLLDSQHSGQSQSGQSGPSSQTVHPGHPGQQVGVGQGHQQVARSGSGEAVGAVGLEHINHIGPGRSSGSIGQQGHNESVSSGARSPFETFQQRRGAGMAAYAPSIHGGDWRTPGAYGYGPGPSHQNSTGPMSTGAGQMGSHMGNAAMLGSHIGGQLGSHLGGQMGSPLVYPPGPGQYVRIPSSQDTGNDGSSNQSSHGTDMYVRTDPLQPHGGHALPYQTAAASHVYLPHSSGLSGMSLHQMNQNPGQSDHYQDQYGAAGLPDHYGAAPGASVPGYDPTGGAMSSLGGPGHLGHLNHPHQLYDSGVTGGRGLPLGPLGHHQMGAMGAMGQLGGSIPGGSMGMGPLGGNMPQQSSAAHGRGSKQHKPYNSGQGRLNPQREQVLNVTKDALGVTWIDFSYTRNRVQGTYHIRCNIEKMDTSALTAKFKQENCIYPRAMVPPGEYRGHRQKYETECNEIGWKLAYLNPELQHHRGVIQRAVDSYRNTSQDMSVRSRRARRLARRQSDAESA